MARSYRRIRPVPDPPVKGAQPDRFVWYEVAAWVSLLGGLAVLLGIALGLRYTWTTVLPSLTDSHPATLTDAVGTVEVQVPGNSHWTVVSQGFQLREGDALRTSQGSRALVTFFDLSTASLYSEASLVIHDMRTNRFHLAPPSTDIFVTQTAGRALFGVAHLNPITRLSFVVAAGAARAQLSEGSYFVKVMDANTVEVVATRGSSVVTAGATSVTVKGGERTLVAQGGKPEAPILAAEDLVQNGSFTQLTQAGLPTGWQLVQAPPEEHDVAGQVAMGTDGTQPVVTFNRSKATYHGEDHIIQTVNQDVTDYSVVRLELRFKIFSQSVSGGGDQGSEYPLMARVNYLDQNGNPAFFVRGFYVQNTQHLPTTNGQRVQPDTWITLVGEQGLQMQGLNPPPRFIQSIDIQASGHDYSSELQRVALIVE